VLKILATLTLFATSIAGATTPSNDSNGECRSVARALDQLQFIKAVRADATRTLVCNSDAFDSISLLSAEDVRSVLGAPDKEIRYRRMARVHIWRYVLIDRAGPDGSKTAYLEIEISVSKDRISGVGCAESPGGLKKLSPVRVIG
jgi:hypothetical protein